MVWAIERFPFEMEGLEARIRTKAIEIANERYMIREISEPFIIVVAINMAYQWFIQIK